MLLVTLLLVHSLFFMLAGIFLFKAEAGNDTGGLSAVNPTPTDRCRLFLEREKF